MWSIFWQCAGTVGIEEIYAQNLPDISTAAFVHTLLVDKVKEQGMQL